MKLAQHVSGRVSELTAEGRTAARLSRIFLILFIAIAFPVSAQVDPHLSWRTMESPHFRVHYSPGLQSLAADAMRYAEAAWAKLSREIKAPRGRIDLVVADNRDFANGYATVFPTNRIVIYAMPPTDVPLLRASNNWIEGVVTHELVHIFHLDRSEGLFRIPRLLFGRNPSMMPNLYSPSWLREGLAVYYESRLTSEGRLRSGEHGMIVRAAAEHGKLPGIGDMSLVTSREPEGHTAYVFGAELVEFLAEKAGPEKMDAFLGSMSATLIPYLYSVSAKKKLGISFGEARRQFSDSMLRTYGTSSPPFSDWRPLTNSGRTAWYPRWLTQDTLVYARADGKSAAGLYKLSTDGKSRRVARRNGVTVNAPAPDGSIMFTQPQFTDTYTIRFDLYKRDSAGRETRLTKGARLTAVDVRRDGESVAVQASAGYTSIVRISPNGERIVPVAGSGLAEYWADPRWSPDGRMIVAVKRQTGTGGTSTLVVVDENGNQTTIAASPALIASPAWIDDGRILFQSDSGRSQIAVVNRDGVPGDVIEISRSSTGVGQPEPTPQRLLAPGSTQRIAAVEYDYRGYRIGIASVIPAQPPVVTLPPADIYRGDSAAAASAAGAGGSAQPDTTSRRYSAWRYMIPRYWVPLAATAENGDLVVGGATSSYDVVDRHSYNAELLVNTGNSVVDGSFSYSFAGLGQPVVNLSARQNSGYFEIFSGTPRELAGYLREQSQAAAMSVQFSRPGFRRAASLSIGGEYERLTYDSDPADLIGGLPNFNPAPREFTSLSAGFSFLNTRRPSLSISPEDGISLSVSARERWRHGSSGPASFSMTGSLRAFKSLNLPGFSHHVLAFRVASGIANSATTSRFAVGGKSGSKIELFPGYSIGDVSRTFPVRGFSPGTLLGLRALTGSVEYRAPIVMPSHGLGMFPLFFDRVSVSIFGDAGSAWCPASYAALPVCDDVATAPGDAWIASTGVELNLDAALQYDAPYRLRVGFAQVLRNRADLTGRGSEVYFTLGFPF